MNGLIKVCLLVNQLVAIGRVVVIVTETEEEKRLAILIAIAIEVYREVKNDESIRQMISDKLFEDQKYKDWSSGMPQCEKQTSDPRIDKIEELINALEQLKDAMKNEEEGITLIVRRWMSQRIMIKRDECEMEEEKKMKRYFINPNEFLFVAPRTSKILSIQEQATSVCYSRAIFGTFSVQLKSYSDRTSLQKDILLMMAVSHPYIIRPFGWTQINGELAMVLPQYEPLTLAVMKKLAKDPNQSIKTLLQIATAIEHLHKNGYHHENIEKENMMISDSGDVLLCDAVYSTKDMREASKDDCRMLIRFISYFVQNCGSGSWINELKCILKGQNSNPSIDWIIYQLSMISILRQ